MIGYIHSSFSYNKYMHFTLKEKPSFSIKTIGIFDCQEIGSILTRRFRTKQTINTLLVRACVQSSENQGVLSYTNNVYILLCRIIAVTLPATVVLTWYSMVKYHCQCYSTILTYVTSSTTPLYEMLIQLTTMFIVRRFTTN